MNVLLPVAIIFGALNAPVRPPEFRAWLVLFEGDPLGCLADGNVKLLATAEITIPNEKSATAVFGRPVPVATVDVLALALRDGKLWIDVIGVRGAPGLIPGAKPARSTRVMMSGEGFRVRLAADSPESQTWVELIVVEVSRGK